jgi:ribonuclease P protein component
MAATPRLRLTPAQRLKTGRDFAGVRAGGQRVVVGCLIANWLVLSSGSVSRVGIVTSKKIGGAVERSRARRLLRETFRLHQHDFERPIDLVLVARNSIAGKKMAEVERDFLEAMRRAKMVKQS